MMAMVVSQQICNKYKPLGEFGENLRDCLNLSFFQSNWLRIYSGFYQKFHFISTMLKLHMENDWKVFIMHLSPTQ